MVQDSVLARFNGDDLRVYVVWTPVLREDNLAAAGKSVAYVADDRAAHYWDQDKSLGFSFGKRVTLPRKRELAWDVYFVFDQQADWTEFPPEPVFWMHQLGLDERQLDGDKLHEAIELLLASRNEVDGP